MDNKPYTDKKLNTWAFMRTFRHDILSEELVWHRDEKDRYIKVLEGSGWEIQYENKLPKKLYKGDYFHIPAKTFHRIKRGSTDLVLKIEEFEEKKWQ
jgi:quercetin dioxygenase-like cupin family protein